MKRDLPDFQPHPLLRNGHVQTIAGVYLPSRLEAYRARRILVPLEDGDQIVLHDDCPPQWREGDKVAVLVHGLAGCHRSPYLVRIAARLNQRGVRTFCMDLRGCGDGLPYATRPFHAGQSDDLKATIATVAQIAEGAPISLIGFSLSGNIVLKLAGEFGSSAPHYLSQTIAIGPPIDLSACARNLQQGLGKIYDRSFLRALRKMRKRRVEAGYPDVDLRPAPRKLYDFDDRYTAPLSGFRDAKDYYEQASSAPLLRRIDVPTLIITAADDPLVPITPFHEVTISPQVEMVITEHGGHLGYVGANNGDPDRRWMDWRIVEAICGPPAGNHGAPGLRIDAT